MYKKNGMTKIFKIKKNNHRVSCQILLDRIYYFYSEPVVAKKPNAISVNFDILRCKICAITLILISFN